jgi:hypothetical protein
MAPDSPFRVSWAPRAVAALKQTTRQAHSSEGRQMLARVVRALDDRLRREPIGLGEVYRSRGPIHEHLAVSEFLAIDFAVDTLRRLVVVRKCRVVFGRTL